MPVLTSAYADLQSTRFQTILVDYGKQKPRQWPLWIKSSEMDVNPTISAKISGLGMQQIKPEGQQFAPDVPIMGPNFQVSATPYGMIFSVSWEMRRDDQYRAIDEMSVSMAKGTRNRQEVQAFAIFNNAPSVPVGYDSQPLISTAHQNLDGSTFANRPATDITLSATAIQAAQLYFDLLDDDRSMPLDMAATRVLVHPSNRYLARELFGSSGKPQTADNDMNSLLPDALTWGFARFLVRTQDWFVMASMAESDAEFLWRDHPRARIFDDPFIEAEDRTIYQRFATRVGDAHWIYGSSVGY